MVHQKDTIPQRGITLDCIKTVVGIYLFAIMTRHAHLTLFVSEAEHGRPMESMESWYANAGL
jgi:hypothetical protein